MTAQKINIYLKALRGSTDHQKMFSGIDQITQMQRIFMETAPPQLAKFCSLGQLSDGKLTVLVGNGGIAAKLKQILPSLLLSLQGRGLLEITAIQIMVQANYHTYSTSASFQKKLKISQTGIESLKKLTENLSTSPLKEAIELMLKKKSK